MSARRNVLLTCAGRRVGLLEALRHELRARLRGARVLAADARPAASPACLLADGHVELPPVTAPGYAAALLAACRAHAVGLLVPTVDPELPGLAALRPTLAAAGTAAVVSDPSLVATCADKAATMALLAAHGLAVPRCFDGAPDAYPAFVKPRAGSGSAGARPVASAAALAAARAADPGLLTMAYLAPATWAEFTLDCLYAEGGRLLAAVPRERVRVRGGEVVHAVTRRNQLVPLVHAHLGRLAGARGPLTVQCFVHRGDGRVVASEINARLGGGYPLSYAAGANYPGYLIDTALCGRPPRARLDAWEAGLTMLRYDAQVLARAAG